MFNCPLFTASLETHLAGKHLSLRTTAIQSAVSTPTLSWLLAGHTPDMESFDHLCGWMQAAPGAFFAVPDSYSPLADPDRLALATSLIRGDPRISTESRERLVALLQAAYRCLTYPK